MTFKKMYKKGKLDFYKDWPEYFFILLLVLGFLVALASRSAGLTYFIIFISGLITGRGFYKRRHQNRFPFILTTLGFLIGFILGGFVRSNADWKIMVILFIIANIISGYAHRKGFMKEHFMD